ncbi:hypothetical protein ACNHKD_05910 [Methylocystis sp. JAN1]|uniref:hypothetical protein n=1 Tax=Methylocystis sp. JAN1 TaxID=3397211 RepID=UPI003FA2B73D
MTDHATNLTIEEVRARIDALLDALVNGRDEETVRELQTLAALERKIGEEPDAFADWL